MSRAEAGLLTDLRFGFGPDVFYLRVDFRPDWKETLAGRAPGEGEPELSIRFSEPRPRVVTVAADATVTIDGAPAPDGVRAARDAILEVAIPFAALGYTTGETLGFHVELGTGKRVFERIPGAETVRFSVPGEDFESVRWRV